MYNAWIINAVQARCKKGACDRIHRSP